MIENHRIIQTPAKLNLRLKVTGRRPDGYHELVSVMVPVTLFDHIELEMKRDQRITLTCEGLSLPNDETNLVYKAAESFFSATGFNPGVSIRLIKRIPVAAGLGGGSSDAACTLKGLNEMCSRPLSYHDLAGLSIRLGADVPFFLHCRPAIARGIGEILNPINKCPKFWYVIIKPPYSVSTASIYSRLKLKLTNGEYYRTVTTLKKEPFEVAGLLENDLESATAHQYPAINTIKNSLVHAGAEGALMSGSGPSVFGVFSSKDRALAAKRHLASQSSGDIYMVEGVYP